MSGEQILQIRIISGRNLLAADSNGKSDPYIVIQLNESKKKIKTRVIKKTLDPNWNQLFSISIEDPATDIIHFIVYDKDKLKSDYLGQAEMRIDDLIQGLEKSVWLPLERTTTGEILVGLKAVNWSGPHSSQVRQAPPGQFAHQYYHQPNPNANYQFPSQAMNYVHNSNPYAPVPFVPPMNLSAAQIAMGGSSPAQFSHPPPAANSQTMVSETALREGFNIEYNELKFVKKIGAGAFGEVWKCEWAGTNVAVKKILQAVISEKDLQEFAREILLMSKLRHPNIVQFLGACSQPEFCLLTEFFGRGSLFDVLAQKQIEMSWDLKLKVISDITSGFLYLHTRNPPIIHRDIKSMNVLVSEDWKCAVADFGLTKIKDRAMLSTRCGSPAWSAPEVLRGEPYNEKADVFSYGIVLWEIITRLPPYAGLNPMQLIGQVAYQRPSLRPPIPEVCPVPGLLDLMVRCWDDTQNTRPDFAQIMEDVKQIKANYEMMQQQTS